MIYMRNQEEVWLEPKFWLQILGDHARFIENSLAPEEGTEIERAKAFIRIFDELLARARNGMETVLPDPFNKTVYDRVIEFRQFKLHLLKRHLTGKLATSLPATFYHHMVNELEEYGQVELEMLLFMEFLEELKQMGLKAEELGSLTPLMADHMAREACYYLMKLSQVSEVQRPECDPAKRRVET